MCCLTTVVGRSAAIPHLAESLLAQLETDFFGPKKHFAESEYRDPIFCDALIDALLQRGTVVYFPKELVALVKRMLGDGTILSLYSGMGEFLLEFGGGIGVEPDLLTVRWSKFLLTIAAIDAEIVHGDPRHWKSEQAFDRIVCNTPFGFKQDQTQLLVSTLRVLYLNPSLDSLVVDPFMILEPCSECHRPELLLLDKFSDKKITYLGNESGHKPTYSNVDKLPLALREAAAGLL